MSRDPLRDALARLNSPALRASQSSLFQTLERAQRAATPSALASFAKLAENSPALRASQSSLFQTLERAQRAATPSALANFSTLAPRPRPVPLPKHPPARAREAKPRTAVTVRALILRHVSWALTALDASLEPRLDGAWERVSEGGPDAASQAAHSLVELIDWTLRTAAPDAEVLDWHQEQQRAASEMVGRKPTRALRARYVLRDRDPDSAVARFYVRQLCELHRLLEQIKHSGGPDDLRTVACLASNAEALLIYLFLPDRVA
jgi:Predicted pPIWI-associating nuclease